MIIQDGEIKMNIKLAATLVSRLLILGLFFWGMKTSYNNGQVKACNMLMSQMIPAQFEPSCKMLDGKLVAAFSSPNGPRRVYDVETGRVAE